MRTSMRVLAFVVGLALVLAVGLGIGRALGPEADEVATASSGHGGHGEPTTEQDAAGPGGEHADAAVAGLQTAEGGHRLVLRDTVLEPSRRELVFTVEGEDGPVTDYQVQHEKELHLVVVRRDLTGFQHVHPELRPDGTWRTLVDLEPGTWRVVADFVTADGEEHVLGTDLFVPGGFQPAPPTGQELSDSVDGYDVNLGGSFAAGAATTLTATVSLDGEVVTDLEPYLGATGHLIALRAGDLGYLHVHEEDGAFHTTFPSAGTYRLFLDFKHRGAVRTAAFTVEVDGAAHDHGSHDHGSDDHGGDDHGSDASEDGDHDH